MRLSRSPQTVFSCRDSTNAKFEKVCSLYHGRIIDFESADRKHMEKSESSIEKRDILPERFIDRPPQQSGRFGVLLVKSTRQGLRHIAMKCCDQRGPQLLALKNHRII